METKQDAAGTSAGRIVRRIVRIVVVIVFAIFCLMSLLYMGINGTTMFRNQFDRIKVNNALTDAMAKEYPASQRRMGAISEALDAEPARRFSVQSCEFTTDGGGWIVDSYSQVCTLDTFAAWPVVSSAEAESAINAVLPEKDLIDAEKVDVQEMDGECFGYRVRDTQDYRWTAEYTVPGVIASDRTCSLLSDFGEGRLLAGSREPIDASQTWLVVSEQWELLDEGIGCAPHWIIPFCENPFGDKIAWGKPPEVS